MNLIELIDHYGFILRNRGCKEAQTFLKQVGTHPEIQKAIIACFGADGKLNNGYRIYVYQKEESHDGSD